MKSIASTYKKMLNNCKISTALLSDVTKRASQKFHLKLDTILRGDKIKLSLK